VEVITDSFEWLKSLEFEHMVALESLGIQSGIWIWGRFYVEMKDRVLSHRQGVCRKDT